MHRTHLVVIVASLLFIHSALAVDSTVTLINPTGRAYTKEPTRLQVSVPDTVKPGTLVVREGGAEIPCQIEQENGRPVLWVGATIAPTGRVSYTVSSGTPTALPAVKITKDTGQYVLDNGVIAVKVPAAATELVGPVSALRLPDGKWIGGSTWQTGLKLKTFTATVVGDGTVFAKLRLRYEFDGMAGLDGTRPAFAEMDLTLAPGWNHVEVAERHEMGSADAWTFELSRGWAPRQGASKPFSGGFSGAPATERELKPFEHVSFPPDTFINLFPRWNQHCKDGWAFTATDGSASAGAVVVRASRWVWPHQNSLRALVKPSGDYAGLRAPTWKGQRLWWLVASAEPVSIGYVAAHAWEPLDKLNNEMILDWNGAFGKIPTINFYSGEVNPTTGIRGRGKSAMANAGKPGDWNTLAEQQVRMHPDSYGSYWNFWSPENPNFFTDFYKIPIALASNLKAHPRFAEIRKQAEEKFMEDLYHSIAMPGGAGQECPGYFDYALRGHLKELAELCKQHLGFDPSQNDRFKAGLCFLDRISQPEGGVRRMLPMGDTHPAKGGGLKLVAVSNTTATAWSTTEFPGFGVIFNSKPGTPEETYLAFKSGPSRGHYHGEQLAFHYGAHAKPLAVDHHCSYHPRAGQEHMHNRVAFWNETFPYANMDSYERLIGFKTAPGADIAIGQVESSRLRKVEKLPPELWHQEYPQIALAKPLVYRRTVVVVKSEPQAYVVLRDQFWGAVDLNATFCLHVLGDTIQQKGPVVDFGTLQLYCAAPATLTFESFPWSHENGGLEATQGARLTQRTENGEFITVLYPGSLPAVTPLPHGVKVGSDEIVFGGTEPVDGGDTVYARVTIGGKDAVTLAGKDVDLNRAQGDIGLFVPDAGYPFGEIPDWLIRRRNRIPDSAPAWVQSVRLGSHYGELPHHP